MDLNLIRSYFPVVESYVYFNNAAESPMNLPYRERLQAFYDLACEAPHTKPDVRQDIRQALSGLMGGQANDYALVTSTGMGVGIVAGGMTFKPGDNILLPENEHRNNLFPWLALKEKGVEVRMIPVADNGYIDLKDIENLIDHKTRLVTIAAVRFNSGFRIDLKALSKLVHSYEALLFVDAIQAAGVVPIDVDDMGIDMMSSAGFKWLFGIAGTGFLFMNERARKAVKPLLPGMFAAKNSTSELTYYTDSRKYETGSLPYSLYYGWLDGLKIIREIGIDNIYERVLKLTGLLIDGLLKRKIEIKTPIDYKKNRSGIVFCTLGSGEKNEAFRLALEEKQVLIAVRDGKCRISPNFFNTEDEIKLFFKVLDQVI